MTSSSPLLAGVALVLAAGAAGCSAASAPPAEPAAAASADARADSAENVRLIGHNDLQGRESLVVVARADAANGNWVYVGHHENLWDETQKVNDITGKMEWNGTSILDVNDPANPKLVWHIPNDANASSRSVSVVYDYKFDGSGKDYLIRNSEYGDTFKFQIFDITSRGTDPTKIALVSEITATPQNSCGRGCGGTLIGRAHKGWWSQETGYFYSAAGEPGFRSTLAQIWDLRDPTAPKFVGRMWIPGQKDGEPGFEGQYAHHPNVDEENKRVYIGYREAGQTASFDISKPASPKLIWSLDLNPPHRGPHTVSPIAYDRVPNFGADVLPRRYALVVDEAGAADDLAPCRGVRSKAYMLDITNEVKPAPVSVWQVPAEEYCNKGGRFGPHQNAETVNGRINRFDDKLAWLAYFNAGIRVVDLSDPYNLREVGSYVPKPTEKSHPIEKGQVVAIQINDIDLDERGLAYASDRTGAGLFILQYTGAAARQGS
jgi:hypothetical protein